MTRSRGFTLIELMITLAVLTILLLLATPSFTDFIQRYRLRGAADDVASVIASARAESLMRNRNVSVVFTGSGSSWCVGAAAAPEPTTLGDPVNSNGSCTCANDCKLSDRVVESRSADYKGVTVATVPTTINFQRATGAVGDFETRTAAFKSPNGKYTLNVAVSPMGRGRLCVPTGSPAMSGFASC